MSRKPLTTPSLPNQSAIDAGLNRGRALRSHALLGAVGALFTSRRHGQHTSEL